MKQREAFESTDSPDGDLAFQAEILQQVSQTYALTIPLLPDHLQDVVGNAYLLCRIADSIEDSTTLTLDEKKMYLEQFSRIVAGDESAEPFAGELAVALGDGTSKAERKLVGNTKRVIRITMSLKPRQREALARCINTMSQGMIEFQQCRSIRGLNDLPHLERYCYFVAGVVGEMLAEVFCDYSAQIDKRSKELHTWAVFCGKGVQLTNIIKDVWDDRREGTCWLPRDIFLESGFDLSELGSGNPDPGFAHGLVKMMALAKYHIHHGLEFALTVPSAEVRIRRHIVWSLGLSAITLRKIYFSESFSKGKDIEISKRSVKITIAILNTLVRSNFALKTFFYILMRPIPHLSAIQHT